MKKILTNFLIFWERSIIRAYRTRTWLTLCLVCFGGISPIFAQFDLSSGVSFNAVAGNPLNAGLQDTAPEDLTFSPDGTRMYFLGSTNDRVYQYNLSTAFDITTATYNNFFAVGGQDAVPRGVAFSTDGTKMFVSGNINVYQYSLSTAFQVNTATYSGTSYVTAAAAGRGVFFSPTGDRMFFTATGDNSVRQYNLSTPYDISTPNVTYIGLFSFATQDSSPQSTFFSPDGLKMFMVGDNTDRVYQYNLSTAFELSTATYSGFSALISSQQTSPTDAILSTDGLRMYVLGDAVGNRSVHQYNLTIYYSRQTGAWNDTNTWSSSCGGAAGIGIPPVGANVIICNGHTVTLTADATCNNLTVNSGGTVNLGAFNFTVNGATVVNGVLRDPGSNTGNFTFRAITVGTTGDFGTSGGSNSAYTFTGNIINNKRFEANGASYTFATNALTIQDNTTFPDQTLFGGGTSSGAVNINVTILESSSHVSLLGSGTGGVNIATGRILRNENTVWGSHTNIGELEGTGTFINATNAVLFYSGANSPMPLGTFDITAPGNTVAYSWGNQNIKAGTYQNLWCFGAGTVKTLEGNITVMADNLWINYATLDVSASNYSVDLKHSIYATNGGSINPRAGTISFTGNADITGNISGATSTLNFYNLIVNKTSATNQVKINNPVNVANTLTLTNGKLYMQNGNLTLTNATPANQILPATPTSASYVATTNNSRALVRQNLAGAGTYIFPVGDATQYQPFVITNPSPTVSVRFGTPTATVPTSGVGSWFVSNGLATSIVRFNNPQGGTILPNISAVGKYNGSAWVAMSGTTYPTGTDYSVSNVFTGGIVEFGILTTNAFRTTWITADNNITILTNTPTYSYNYNITWKNLTSAGVGDGSVTGVTSNYTITGLTNGHTYQIDIVGVFPHFYMNNDATNKAKLRTIQQWGNIAWASMESAFWGCINLQLNTTDVPNLSAIGMSLNNMFRGCTAFTGNSSMNSWNTTATTNMNSMFQHASAFNQPIGSWNTGAVTDMGYMFFNATSFNQNIENWNTAAVTNMIGMFYQATAFNQPIGGWSTGVVTDMSYMFFDATSFNQNIGNWNIASVTNMSLMFSGATAFNQSLGSWVLKSGVGAVNMTFMLDGCGMSTANYDATLIGWAGQASLPTGVTLGATGRTYCTGFGARNTLISSKGWTFSGDALSGSCPSFSAVTATNVTATSFTANWTADAGAVSYRLDISTVSNFASFVAGYNDLPVGNVGSYNITVPSVGTYYYRIKSYNGVPTLLNTSNTKAVSTNLPAGSGNVLTFDGMVGKKVDIPHHSAIDFIATNNHTLEAWIKINAIGTVMDIISKTNGVTSGYALIVTSMGQLAIRRGGSTAEVSSVLPTGVWLHVAVSITGSSTFVSYVNGVPSATGGLLGLSSNALNLTIGERPSGGFPFKGQIDEVKIWNVARTEAEIRASMCAKLVGTESGLVGYFRLDENTGTTVENKAYLATTDGSLVSSPTWATSSAPLGDVSAYTYGSSSVTLSNTDVMQASNMTGTPTGVHLYKVNQTPNEISAPTGYASLYTDRYFGMFFVGGTSPQATLTYSYGNNTAVDVANALRFAERDNNADNTWAKMGGVQNRLAKRLTHRETNAGEFVLAERNAIITNYKDGGTILTYDNTNTGYVQMPRYVENDFTIEFWLRTTQTGVGTAGQWETGTGLVTANVAGSNDFGITLISNKVTFGTGASANTLTSVTTVNNGKWNHIAVTRTKSTGALVLYVNGKPEANITGANTGIDLLGAANIHIGKLFTGTNYFNGSIDELRIWNTALDENTIKDWVNLRAQDQHPNFANLEAYYRFDENTGVLAEDLVNGNDATLTGGVTWGDANMPLGDGAVSRLIVPATSGTVSVFPEAGVTMNFGTITPDGEVVATRIDGEPESYPAVAGMSFMNAYWVIRNYGTNQTFSALPEITFEVPVGNTISAADLANPFNIKLYKRPDDAVGSTVGVGNWQAVASATGFGSIRFGGDCCSGGGGGTSIEDYSQFVIGSASSPLPITLVGFAGERVTSGQGNGFTEEVRLEWSTASEINNKGFEVEMSVNGLAYTKIAFVDGKGNSTTIQPYSHTTIQPNEAYYRLRQVDFNGTFSYSPVVFVTGMVGKNFVRVYPNPAKEQITIALGNIPASEVLKATVFNTNGKRVWKGTGKLDELQNALNQQFSSWKTGVYILQIQTNKRTLQTKIVKE
jgi:surface protein